MEPTIYPTPEALGAAIADRILAGVEAARAAERPYLLGCPTGRTPRPIYAAMAERVRAAPRDLSHLRIVLMDEYLEEIDGKLVWAPADAHFSCRGFAAREIEGPLNEGLPEAFRVGPARAPEPEDPAAFDRWIAEMGGIDLFILASGASDGHVAFNPPGSERHSRSRIIELAQETRQDNMRSFPQFATLTDVPTHGVSVGLRTIADAKAAVMVLVGEGKRMALRRLLAASAYDPAWPATIIHDCNAPEIAADTAAAGG